MAQIMKIMVFKTNGDNVEIPLSQEESFKNFQQRVFGEFNIHLDKSHFSGIYNNLSEDDNLYNFIKTHVDLSNSEEEPEPQTIIYQIQLTDADDIIKSENLYPNLTSTGEEFTQENLIVLSDGEEPSYNNDLSESMLGIEPVYDSVSNFNNYMDSIESKLSKMHKDNLDDYCRLCATTITNLKFSFQNGPLLSMINKVLPIRVFENDGLPHQLCESCLKNIESFHNFVQIVVQAEKILKDKFKTEQKSCNANLEIETDPSLILDHIRCRLCDLILFNIDDATKHAIEIHKSTDGYCSCVICDLRFVNTDLLTKHMLVHQKYMPRALHCEICNEAYSSKLRLNFHRQFHLKGSKLYCNPCKESFITEEDLFNHVCLMHNFKIYTCNVCHEMFLNNTQLEQHMFEKHSTFRQYKCDVCHKSFLDKQTLQEHEMIHLETKPYQCHICGKSLNRLSRLKKHLLTHESDPEVVDVHVCFICKEVFANEYMAKDHEKEKHGNNDGCIKILSTDKVFMCEFCEKSYCSTEALNSHRNNHTGDTPYSCKVCNSEFPTYSRRNTHKSIHGYHKEGSDPENFPVPRHFLCEHCGKSYTQWNYLSYHRKLKHSEKQVYVCTECDMEFNSTWALSYHKKVKHQTTPYKCYDCGKTLNSLQLLKLHRSQHHSGQKDVQCEKCKKVFAQQISLNAHMKFHSHEFSCNYCGKKFLDKTERDEHEQYHLGKPKFSCESCNKSFKTKALLNEHVRIHVQERPFTCDVCGLSFRKAFALRNHKFKHNRAKQSGNFVLMVDMKEDTSETTDQEMASQFVQTIMEPTDDFPQFQTDSNYVDVGNGNYLKLQGNTINIDGQEYILINQNEKQADSTTEPPVQLDQLQAYNNMMLVDPTSQHLIMDAQNQIQPEYTNTTFVIGDHLVLDSENQLL